MYLFWFLCGMLVAVCICGKLFEKVLDEYDQDVDKNDKTEESFDEPFKS